MIPSDFDALPVLFTQKIPTSTTQCFVVSTGFLWQMHMMYYVGFAMLYWHCVYRIPIYWHICVFMIWIWMTESIWFSALIFGMWKHSVIVQRYGRWYMYNNIYTSLTLFIYTMLWYKNNGWNLITQNVKKHKNTAHLWRNWTGKHRFQLLSNVSKYLIERCNEAYRDWLRRDWCIEKETHRNWVLRDIEQGWGG